ncbi:MAG: ATP-binding cassette domain-containing protein [archaeon]|nr:ATP-binding cassette domain-containing protein [archaeon]
MNSDPPSTPIIGSSIKVIDRDECSDDEESVDGLEQRIGMPTTTPAVPSGDAFGRAGGINRGGGDDATAERIAVLFDNLGYCVTQEGPFLGRCRGKPKTTALLEGISGYFCYGELVALMGGSGAGKSTLLDMLALRKDSKCVTGTILFDGKLRTGLNTQDAAYVLQTDVTLANLSVYETLMFAARFRMPQSYGHEDLRRLVDSLLRELRLEEVKDSRVGSPLNRGISGGEMRRLAIAEGLMTNPRLLFLDEPTSGLDSSAAYGVAKLLRRLSRTRNQVIICSIHQPSPQLFNLFDKAVILSKGSDKVGRVAYLGPVAHFQPYITAQGYPVPPDYNIADFAVELATSLQRWRAPEPTVAGGSSTVEIWKAIVQEEHDASAADQGPGPDMSELWHQSAEGRAVKDAVTGQLPSSLDDAVLADEPVRYSSTLWHQFYTFTMRAYYDCFRDPGFFFRRIVKVHVIGFLIATLYTQLSVSSAIDIQNTVSLLFFMMITTFLMAQVFLGVFLGTRPLTTREREARLYGAFAQFMGTLASSLPLETINGFIFFTYVYWICGLRADPSAYFSMVALYLVVSLWMNSMVMFVSSVSPNAEVAITILPVMYDAIFPLSTFCFLSFLLNHFHISSDLPSF